LEKALYLDQLQLSDKVYACEKACFDAEASQCHLAACLGKTMSTEWNMEGCTGTLDPNVVSKFENARGSPLGKCNRGKQVGAICGDNGSGKTVFCTTEMECKAQCGNKSCRSLSLSCLDSCR